MPILNFASSVPTAVVGASSVSVKTGMASQINYVITTTQPVWVKQSSGGTAATAGTSGETLIPAGVAIEFAGSNGAQLTAIQAGASAAAVSVVACTD